MSPTSADFLLPLLRILRILRMFLAVTHSTKSLNLLPVRDHKRKDRYTAWRLDLLREFGGVEGEFGGGGRVDPVRVEEWVRAKRGAVNSVRIMLETWQKRYLTVMTDNKADEYMDNWEKDLRTRLTQAVEALNALLAKPPDLKHSSPARSFQAEWNKLMLAYSTSAANADNIPELIAQADDLAQRAPAIPRTDRVTPLPVYAEREADELLQTAPEVDSEERGRSRGEPANSRSLGVQRQNVLAPKLSARTRAIYQL